MPRLNLGTFSLDVPGGWTLTSVILAGPVEDQTPEVGLLRGRTARPFQQNLISTMEQVPPDITPESYVRRQIEGLRQAGVGRQEARAPERVQLVNGVEGLLTEAVIMSEDGDRVRQMQLVAIKNGTAHTVIISRQDGLAFERARQQYRAMLLSFL